MQQTEKWSLSIVLIFLLCVGGTLASAQSEIVLHSFTGADGNGPASGLIYDNATGAFYGTTYEGGSQNNGTVFQLAPDGSGGWTESVLYNFSGTDGSGPDYGLLATHKNGVISALYGTTYFGGQYNYGTIFELTPAQGGAWNEAVLYSFASGADGESPDGGLVMDKNGALYGVTVSAGKSGVGILFKLTPSASGWKKSVLWNFSISGGGQPQGHLIFDKTGALYGTTTIGGPRYQSSGTVFRLKPPASGHRRWTYSVLHTFVLCSLGPDAGVIFDSNGTLYGTTLGCGQGTVFALRPPAPGKTRWTETVLYDFGAGKHGADPAANLIFDPKGSLYGTASVDGPLFGGTLFKLSPTKTPPWKFTVLWSFGGTSDGNSPRAPVMLHAGELYSTTAFGGAYGYGTVFQVKP